MPTDSVANVHEPSDSGFYEKLSLLLSSADISELVRTLCESRLGNSVSRLGISPRVYFSILLVGYIQEFDSFQEIAEACATNRVLRDFLLQSLIDDISDDAVLTSPPNPPLPKLPDASYQILRRLAKQHIVSPNESGTRLDNLMRTVDCDGTDDGWCTYVENLTMQFGEEVAHALREGDQELMDELRNQPIVRSQPIDELKRQLKKALRDKFPQSSFPDVTRARIAVIVRKFMREEGLLV